MSVVLSIKYPDSSELVEFTEGVFTLGRSRKTDIRLKDEKVSGKHIAIELKDDKFTLKDIGSTNGTFLNGNKIDDRVLDFYLGDEIQIGRTVISIDKNSLNSLELKKFSTRQDKDKTEMKFISPISENELNINEEDNGNETEEAESPPLTEINFSLDLADDSEDNGISKTNDSNHKRDEEETIKIRKEPFKEEISASHSINISDSQKHTTDDTRTNYVLDAEEIKTADTDSLQLERKKQGQVIQKKFKKKDVKEKEPKEKKGFFSKFFK